MNPEEYMREALAEAAEAEKKEEVPVGAVIVRGEEIIARAHNLKEAEGLALCHAEMMAIREACRKLDTWCLDDCDMYVTLEPCMMCTGAIILSRIRRLYYGTADPKGGCVDTLVQIKTIKHINHHPEIFSGILKEDCAAMLTGFFRRKRQKPRRDPESFKK